MGARLNEFRIAAQREKGATEGDRQTPFSDETRVVLPSFHFPDIRRKIELGSKTVAKQLRSGITKITWLKHCGNLGQAKLDVARGQL